MRKRVRRVTELARRLADRPDVDHELAVELRSACDELNAEDLLQLFMWLSADLEVEKGQIEPAIARVIACRESDREAWNRHLLDLRRALASPRHRVLEGLINTPGGMEYVLELRAEVLDAQRQGEDGLEALEEDIAHLLDRWCQHGLLYLEEIDLGSSYRTVRFLKERELVHPMMSLEEMGRRLGEDRMCFGLYHAAMPDEPVVFIEVALSRGLVRSIDEIIGERGERRAPLKSPDTAIFYSINNTQNGLAGLGLGQVLIVRVTDALRQRRPSLETFATLSPMPGFWPRYLRPILEGDGAAFSLDRDAVVAQLSGRARTMLCDRHREMGGGGDDPAAALAAVLASPEWIGDRALSRALRRPLLEIAYHYLAEERDARGKPLNPVAGFHLGNGANLTRGNINFAANVTPRGLEESCGLMVNYLYSDSTLARIRRAFRSLLPWRSGGHGAA